MHPSSMIHPSRLSQPMRPANRNVNKKSICILSILIESVSVNYEDRTVFTSTFENRDIVLNKQRNFVDDRLSLFRFCTLLDPCYVSVKVYHSFVSSSLLCSFSLSLSRSTLYLQMSIFDCRRSNLTVSLARRVPSILICCLHNSSV